MTLGSTTIHYDFDVFLLGLECNPIQPYNPHFLDQPIRVVVERRDDMLQLRRATVSPLVTGAISPFD